MATGNMTATIVSTAKTAIMVTTITRASTATKGYNCHECHKVHTVAKVTMTRSLTRATIGPRKLRELPWIPGPRRPLGP